MSRFLKLFAFAALSITLEIHGVSEPSAYVAPAIPNTARTPIAPMMQPPTYQEVPIWVPGISGPVPNLPHGPETSTDRRAQYIFQTNLYEAPLTNHAQYMGRCTQ
jgi:hypothetical protein